MMNNALSTMPTCIGFYRSGEGYRSSEDQINLIERAAKTRRLDLLRVRDVSLGNFKQLDELVNEIGRAKVDCLIIWRLDCLAPLITDFEAVVKFVAQLSGIRVTFISIEDNIDLDESADRVISNLYSAWIELKQNRKIENARRSALKAKASGNKTGPKKKRDDEQILKLHREGQSIRKIAKETNLSPALIHQVIQKLARGTLEDDKSVTDHGPEVV